MVRQGDASVVAVCEPLRCPRCGGSSGGDTSRVRAQHLRTRGLLAARNTIQGGSGVFILMHPCKPGPRWWQRNHRAAGPRMLMRRAASAARPTAHTTSCTLCKSSGFDYVHPESLEGIQPRPRAGAGQRSSTSLQFEPSGGTMAGAPERVWTPCDVRWGWVGEPAPPPARCRHTAAAAHRHQPSKRRPPPCLLPAATPMVSASRASSRTIVLTPACPSTAAACTKSAATPPHWNPSALCPAPPR